MDPNPIRPTRGKARGRPVLPQSLVQPGQPQDISSFRNPRPVQPNVPAQPIQQPISTTGTRPLRQPLQRPVGPVARTPRPMGPRPGSIGDAGSSTVEQGPPQGVRSYFILPTLIFNYKVNILLNVNNK